jgi:hypothetical protein
MEGAGGVKLQLVLLGLWASVESKAAVVLIYVFHILQSINDISDYHKFFSALQATFQVNQENGDQFHGYKVRNCVAILHSMVCGLAILRALCTRPANATF